MLAMTCEPPPLHPDHFLQRILNMMALNLSAFLLEFRRSGSATLGLLEKL
jgi:hypothetical protein